MGASVPSRVLDVSGFTRRVSTLDTFEIQGCFETV